MPTARQQQFLTQLTPLLGSIANHDPATLVQRDRLGTALCFELHLPLFIDVIGAASQLQRLDLSKVPYGILSQLVGPFQQLANLLSQVAGFSPNSHGNPTMGRDNLANAIEDQWNSVFLIVQALLGSPGEDTVRKELDVLTSQIRTTMQLSSDALSALNDKKTQADHALESFLKEKSANFEREGQEKLQKVDAALDQVRKAAGEAGVSQTSRHFSQEATEHMMIARLWLVALVIVGLALIAFALFGTSMMEWAGVHEPLLDAPQVVQIKYLAQKGLLAFCLFFGLIWTAKNYGASRHNYIVNKHRSNALGSFQAFASSAADEQTKAAVLIQATQSIFSPQASGYVKNDGENSSSSPIIEILRSAGTAKDK